MPATKTFAGLTLYVPSATGLRTSGPTVGLAPGTQVAVPDGAVGVGVAPPGVGDGDAPVGAGVAPVGAGVAPVGVGAGAREDVGVGAPLLGMGVVPVGSVTPVVVGADAGWDPITVPEAHATSSVTPRSQTPKAPRSEAGFTLRARPACAAPERALGESRPPGRPN